MNKDLPKKTPNDVDDENSSFTHYEFKSYIKRNISDADGKYQIRYLVAKHGVWSVTAYTTMLKMSRRYRFLGISAMIGSDRDGAPSIERPPGFQLVRFLEFICRRKTVEHIIEPMHAEFLTEYYAAVAATMMWKARYIKGQMRFYLLYAVVSEKVFALIGKCFNASFKAKSED